MAAFRLSLDGIDLLKLTQGSLNRINVFRRYMLWLRGYSVAVLSHYCWENCMLVFSHSTCVSYEMNRFLYWLWILFEVIVLKSRCFWIFFLFTDLDSYLMKLKVSCIPSDFLLRLSPASRSIIDAYLIFPTRRPNLV